MKKKKRINKNKVPKAVYIAGAICAVSFIFLLICMGVAANRAPEFIPPAFEPEAETGTPEVPEELGWSLVWQPGMDFKAAVCGVFTVVDGRADIYFANLEGGAWLKLRVLDEAGNILGETGLIKPGEYLRSVSLGTIPENGAPVIMKLMAYEPETYYSMGSVSLQTSAVIGGA